MMALKNKALVTAASATVLWSAARASESKESEDWQIVKEVLSWAWPHLHDLFAWLGTHMVTERWKLIGLWLWSAVSAVILAARIWQAFASRTWRIEDRTNRLEWRMLQHPKSWAYSDLRADAKQLKEVIGGPYHYDCGGEIRYIKDPAINMDRPLCSRCDRSSYDGGVKAAVPTAYDRLAVGREMQRLYRICKQRQQRWPPPKVISLDWTDGSSGRSTSRNLDAV
jgi:hypothetical protein